MSERRWEAFWEALDRLLEEGEVVIDRPRESLHGCFPQVRYPLDCGYLASPQSEAGEEMEVWMGSEPVRQASALFLAVDEHNLELQRSLGIGLSASEIESVVAFYSQIGLNAIPIHRTPESLRLLTERRSVRRFLDRPVERALIERAIELACWAPSAHNEQPWRFVVISDAAARERLAHALGEVFRQDLLAQGIGPEEIHQRLERSRQRMLAAPVAVLLCLAEEDLPAGKTERQRRGEWEMAVQSVALAGGQFQLAAHALGLATVWICAPLFAPEAAQNALNYPPSWQAQALILVGYAAEQPGPPLRKSLAEVMLYL
ncbi:MAG: nitroreductase family protein [Anaerolineales bacterium]|nr:nitroreductase family protein [Anaerolineales bacterium]MDW8162159.1 nitroreductase family protein [Anaerolineales bacterium]